MKVNISNLKKSYAESTGQLTVIESLNVEFPTNTCIAIVGASGIGKSTLLHLLGGLDAPTEGKVILDEIDIFSLSNEALSQFRGKNIGFIFQFHHLLPEFTALENIYMPLLITGISEAEASSEAKRMLESVGLSHRATHRPGELSGGEQQRVAIARAMVTRPRMILADEPTGNLDFKTANEIQGVLINATKELKSTLIVVTHNAELARHMDITYEMQPGGNLRPV